MEKLERQARAEANVLRFAYLSEKNPVKAGKILKLWDAKMQQVHRIVANMLIAKYGFCPRSYRKPAENQRQPQKVTQSPWFYLFPSYSYA